MRWGAGLIMVGLITTASAMIGSWRLALAGFALGVVVKVYLNHLDRMYEHQQVSAVGPIEVAPGQALIAVVTASKMGLIRRPRFKMLDYTVVNEPGEYQLYRLGADLFVRDEAGINVLRVSDWRQRMFPDGTVAVVVHER